MPKKKEKPKVCPTCGRGNFFVWQPNTYPPPQRTIVYEPNTCGGVHQ